MFPASFEYAAPGSLDEALSLLAERGDDAKVLAGGQSLIPLMKLRFATPELIVDINRIPGLDQIEEADGHLRVGALARNSELAASDLLKARYPVMAAAAPLISDPVVRNLGTLAGSLAHADPAGDWGSVMLALGAEVVVASSSGTRTVPIDEFLQGTFTTALEPEEIVTEVRVPAPAGRWGGTYLKLERKVGDFATVARGGRDRARRRPRAAGGHRAHRGRAAQRARDRGGGGAGGRRAHGRGVRRGRAARGRGCRPRVGRARVGRVQARGGARVRAARARRRARDGRSGLRGG